jgi:hypothetical protein
MVASSGLPVLYALSMGASASAVDINRDQLALLTVLTDAAHALSLGDFKDFVCSGHSEVLRDLCACSHSPLASADELYALIQDYRVRLVGKSDEMRDWYEWLDQHRFDALSLARGRLTCIVGDMADALSGEMSRYDFIELSNIREWKFNASRGHRFTCFNTYTTESFEHWDSRLAAGAAKRLGSGCLIREKLYDGFWPASTPAIGTVGAWRDFFRLLESRPCVEQKTRDRFHANFYERK